ncbi:hypothetical protein EYF80_004443 [Liparis tanakae]|uniref:Uncharacterized protein n=1 Tax=Liparis tanakae TaxID=230148 RepID=A0A4Z2J670_9TELE|nr:hypothetical protein EYF80_004443 [Liparis tanakae]
MLTGCGVYAESSIIIYHNNIEQTTVLEEHRPTSHPPPHMSLQRSRQPKQTEAAPSSLVQRETQYESETTMLSSGALTFSHRGSPSLTLCSDGRNLAGRFTSDALTGPEAFWGSSVSGGADPSEDGHPLSDGGVEVVVVGDGGDPEAGVVLRRGVGPIAVARYLGDAVIAAPLTQMRSVSFTPSAVMESEGRTQ